MGIFKVDDIIAALLLSLAMFRRLETLSIRKEDQPHVPSAAFDEWRKKALAGYTFLASACVLKVAASVLWFLAFRSTQGVLQVGGLIIFIAWIVAVMASWRRLTETSLMRRELGIGRPPAK